MPYYTKQKKFIYFREEQWFRTDNLLFFHALKIVSPLFAFSCRKSPLMGKCAYTALKALKTANTLHIGGMQAKATQNNRFVAKPFFTGSGTGYNKHNFDCPFLADSDKHKKEYAFWTCNPHYSELKCGHKNKTERGV